MLEKQEQELPEHSITLALLIQGASQSRFVILGGFLGRAGQGRAGHPDFVHGCVFSSSSTEQRCRCNFSSRSTTRTPLSHTPLQAPAQNRPPTTHHPPPSDGCLPRSCLPLPACHELCCTADHRARSQHQPAHDPSQLHSPRLRHC